MIGLGDEKRILSQQELHTVLNLALDEVSLKNKRVLVIIPDSTRTFPHALFFKLLTQSLIPVVKSLNFLIALGTHPPLSEQEIYQLMGIHPEAREKFYKEIGIFNHAWKDPTQLISLGTIPEKDVKSLSGGYLNTELPVNINRLVLEHDHIIICGPVFPHEVVGFSGGNKYFFPGVSGEEMINLTHWLGALITSYELIGQRDSPVRAIINRASTMIPRPKTAICAVTSADGVHGLYIGEPEEAFIPAVDLSSRIHIQWMEKPFQQVLSVIPPMYTDLWVGAKGIYKVEPVVEAGGEIILYAPHIKQISVSHEFYIRMIGYHVVDYFTHQMERFSHIPLSVLAHSTHVRGIGSFTEGIEKPRINVVLATGLPPELCEEINLGYRDHSTIHFEDFRGKEEKGILFVPRAGEDLFRLQH